MATGPENTTEPTTQNGDPRFQTDNSVSKKTQPKQQLSKAMEHMRFAVTADPIPHASTPIPPTDSLDPTVQSLSPQSSDPQTENDAYGVPASFAPVRNPASRSHDPTNNQKRSDPFAFGSRYLEEGDNIFEFNAWDHVSVDSTYLAFSEEQYAKQRQDPVSDFDRARFNAQPEKWWNTFYKNNKANFFKNRKWLAQEFPVLHDVGKEDAGEAVVLEVGAGAGNSAFPILQNSRNEKLRIHACDFSKKAVELIRANELYDESKIRADVWDVAASPDSENNGLPPGLSEGSVDVVLMIFIFSALNPTQWDQAVRNIWRVLKPGGQVLFRDYGRGDLAQVRFKKGRWMEENFYVRGDGTRVYFFEKDELEEIWGGKKREAPDESPSENNNSKQTSTELVDALVQETGDPSLAASAAQHKDTKDRSSELVDALVQQTGDTSLADSASQHKDQIQNTTTSNLVDALVQETGDTSLVDSAVKHREAKATPKEQGPRPVFEVAHIGVDRRMLVNRQRRLKMYRCWMQAVFRKAGDESKVATSTLRQEKQDENGEEEE